MTNLRKPQHNSSAPSSLLLALPKPEVPLVTNLPKQSFARDQYRRLALQVLEWSGKSGVNGPILGLTSPEAGAGKTVTSLNLAITLAEVNDEGPILLLEGDLWRPRFLEYLEIHRSVSGLGDALYRGRIQKNHFARLRDTKLDLVFAEPDQPAPDLMSGPRLRSILREIQGRYHMTILDCPPLALASGYALANYVDAVLMVVGAKKTRKSMIKESLSQIDSSKLLGVVLNGGRAERTELYPYHSYVNTPTKESSSIDRGTGPSAM